MALIRKEFYFMKSQWKKNILTLLALCFIVGFFLFNHYSDESVMFIGAYVPGIIICMQLIQNSIEYEKVNKTFEKMLTGYSLPAILLSKCAACSITASVLGYVFGSVSYAGISHNPGPMNSLKVLAGVLILMTMFNLLIAMIMTLLFLFINQTLIINLILTGLIAVIVATGMGIGVSSHIALYVSICSAVLLLLCIIIAYLFRFISNDKVVN